MTEPTTEQTPAVNADTSLADYRASRETPAEAKPVEIAEDAPAGSDAGATDLDEGGQDESSEQSGEAAGDEKPKKKGGFQRTIEKKDREIEDLKRKLAEKPAEKPAEETPAQADEPKFDAPKPKLEDFDSIEAFTEALTDWKADEREWKRGAAQAQADFQAELQATLDGWNSRKAAAQKTLADYDEVVGAVDDVKLSPAHQRALLTSEHGPELAYLLAQDRTQLEAIAAMDPVDAAVQIGKLEAKHFGEAALNEETKVSKAPRPIKPVGGRASNAGYVDVASASLADYRKARESGKLR
jgi:hypothetical protein